jgi:hypothetical protein
MTQISTYQPADTNIARPRGGEGLADVLERVLDKGLVIAGDIRINLLDIELLTIKVRLLIASADKAREMGIDWWAHDPHLSSKADGDKSKIESADHNGKAMDERLDRLERQLEKLLQRELPATSRRAKRG